MVVPSGAALGSDPVLVVNPGGQTAGGLNFDVTAKSTPAPQGPLQIGAGLPVPNPNPSSLAIDLLGDADAVEAVVYTAAFVEVVQVDWGPQAAGWSSRPLPATLRNLSNGLYYVLVRARRGSALSSPVVIKMVELR